MTENEKQLVEHEKETQENSPEVSDDMKKKEEQNNISEQTEISAADLQKQVKEKLVMASSKEDREKLLQIGSDIETNKDDQSFLTKTSEELKHIAVEQTDKKADEKPKS